MEDRILQLETKIQELTIWKESFRNQQVQKPIGTTSRKIIQKDLLVSTGQFGEPITTDCFLEVRDPDGIIWWLGAEQQ